MNDEQKQLWRLGREVAALIGAHSLRPSRAEITAAAQALGIPAVRARRALDAFIWN